MKIPADFLPKINAVQNLKDDFRQGKDMLVQLKSMLAVKVVCHMYLPLLPDKVSIIYLDAHIPEKSKRSILGNNFNETIDIANMMYNTLDLKTKKLDTISLKMGLVIIKITNKLNKSLHSNSVLRDV